MSGAQTLLVIGAMALMGLLILTMHGSIASSQDSTYRSNIINESVILAQEKINEISVNSFAAIEKFKDYDKVDTLSSGEIYRTLVEIDYVNPDNPDQISGSETTMKRIKVTTMPDSISRQTFFHGNSDQFSVYYYKSE